MEIIRTEQLSEEQKAEITVLIEHLKKVQGLTLSFPFEYASHFYLLYENSLIKELVSILALIMPEQGDIDTPAECAAFTAPSHQKKGYFSLLFEEAQEIFKDTDLVIYTDGTSEGALKSLASLEAEWDFDEHRMEISLDFLQMPESEKCPSLLFQTEDLPETPDLSFSFFESDHPGVSVGKACASLSGSCACLYGFEIETELRGLGYGKAALSLFLAHLKELGCKTVFLHVSGENEAALHLYKKTGFRITETLSCYLY